MRKRKENKAQRYMAYFIAFLMVGSLFGIIFLGFRTGNTSDVQTTYNGFEFGISNNYWTTEISGQEAFFSYLPTDLASIPVEDRAISALRNTPQVQTTSDFNDTYAQAIALANYELGRTLSDLNVFINNGFTTAQGHSLPVITCDNATQHVPIIYFKQSNFTKLTFTDNCVMAEASDPNDVIRLKDRIVYGMFGVMQ